MSASHLTGHIDSGFRMRCATASVRKALSGPAYRICHQGVRGSGLRQAGGYAGPFVGRGSLVVKTGESFAMSIAPSYPQRQILTVWSGVTGVGIVGLAYPVTCLGIA